MKIKEAVELYNKYERMKYFKELLGQSASIKMDIDDYPLVFEAHFKCRFGCIIDDLKDLADVAIKKYEEILNGEYEKG